MAGDGRWGGNGRASVKAWGKGQSSMSGVCAASGCTDGGRGESSALNCPTAYRVETILSVEGEKTRLEVQAAQLRHRESGMSQYDCVKTEMWVVYAGGSA